MNESEKRKLLEKWTERRRKMNKPDKERPVESELI